MVPPVARRRGRGRRFGLIAAGLLVAVGLGWAGGLNTHRIMDLDVSRRILATASTKADETWAWLQGAISSVRAGTSNSEDTHKEVAGIGENPAGSVTAPEQPGQDAASAAIHDVSRMITDLSARLDQLRESSEGTARDLTTRVERVREVTERSHRELVAKLAQLGERVERLEKQMVAESVVTRTAQPAPQPNTASAARSTTIPAPLPAPGSDTRTALRSPAEARSGTDPRVVENWVVRGVFDGVAILQGPRGTVEVSRGDMVPGVGRVEAIQRRGSNWVVVTNRGLITMD